MDAEECSLGNTETEHDNAKVNNAAEAPSRACCLPEGVVYNMGELARMGCNVAKLAESLKGCRAFSASCFLKACITLAATSNNQTHVAGQACVDHGLVYQEICREILSRTVYQRIKGKHLAGYLDD